MKPASLVVEKPTFKSAYTPTEEVALTFPLEELPYGRTQQSFKDDSDINNIMERYLQTGMIDYVKENQPHYADVTGLEFQTCMNKIVEASEMFDALPAKIRKRFNNEPAEFLDFVQDDANRDEAITLGIIAKPAETAPKEPETGTTAGNEPAAPAQ